MTVAIATSVLGPRFHLVQTESRADDFARDVREGLTAAQKWLPPRWFYDALGSALFDAICFLPEYYVMRAEAEVLAAHGDEIVDAFGANVRIVELGSGAARKTRLLLDRLTERQSEVEYVPVDVDAQMLERSGRELLHDYANLCVLAVRADFTRPKLWSAAAKAAAFKAPAKAGALQNSRSRTVVLFLGSTIGNLDPAAAVAMLRDLRNGLTAGDALFLGADLRKSRDVLEPAYDDALGVTAAFNLNLLARINRELGGTFAVGAFRHRAFYDQTHGRIEMHLASKFSQRVRIEALDLEVAFDEGETIHTESSYKHDDASLASLAEASGFAIEKTWRDSRAWFANVLMLAQ
ncbi:MAG TPA: L-histidine N(alpha)-methyltransferase [Thermoanaerobaculia bacterium]|nr:L-histidine N(alpha)-methyltransferase [Thermoanaerobaculia bacterium]